MGFDSAKARQSSAPRTPMSRNELVFTVPASLSILLDSDAAHNVSIEELPQEVSDNVQNDTPSTWIFEDRTLSALRSVLWERVNKLSGDNLARIPTYGGVLNGVFPYEGTSEATGEHI